MRRWRIVLYVIGCFAVLAAAGVGAVFYFTQGAASSADAFFGTIAESGAAAAYRQTSPAFQATRSEASFTALADKLGLARFKSASWTDREMSGGQTALTGTLTLSDGGALPATVKLVKSENGGWQVFALDIGGTDAGPAKPAVPDQMACNDLVKTTLGRLGAAINANDFRGLLLTSSRPMQQQLTPEKLQATFHGFIEQHVDLGRALLTDPVLTAPPAVDGDGRLALTGYSPLPQQNWYFDLAYVYEHPEWKLISIEVSSKPIK